MFQNLSYLFFFCLQHEDYKNEAFIFSSMKVRKRILREIVYESENTKKIQKEFKTPGKKDEKSNYRK